jgi:tetratricopeptide (TPR) repeat protein
VTINFQKYFLVLRPHLRYIVLVIPLSIIFSFQVNAQESPAETRKIDSLKTIIAANKHDTIVVKALFTWDNIIYRYDSKLDLELNLKIEAICKRNLKKKLSPKKERFFKNSYASSLNNIGGNYLNQGNYAKAIEYNMHGLTVYEQINDLQGTANALNNIGIIYKDQKKYEQAIDYIERSIDICEKLKDTLGAGQSYGNIGVIYQMKGDLSMALQYFNKCLRVIEPFGEKLLMAMTYINIGVVYHDKKDNAKALEFYNKALKIYEEIDNREGIATVYCNVGSIYAENREYQKAIELNLKALAIAKEINRLLHIQECSKSLYTCYKALGNFKEALAMNELYTATSDSITNEESQREITRQEFKYKYEKKAMADSVRVVQEKKVAAVMLRQEQMQRYILYIGLAITFIFGIFMLNRFRRIRRQKNIIEEQKRIVEEQKHLVDQKQKEVLDSILYARRIQRALLPSQKYFEKHLGKK